MRRAIISIAILSLVTGFNLPLFSFSAIPPGNIEQTLLTRINRQINQGIVVAVVSSEGIRYYKAGIYREGDERPVNENTVFEIGSVTNVFTSLLLSDMVEKEEIALNDPIDKYLPTDIVSPAKNGHKISLLHLATYVSGLPPQPDNLEVVDLRNPFAGYTIDQFYTFLNNYQLETAPGNTYEYSYFGVGLLGHILSLKSKDSFENILKKRILNKLGMDATSVKLSETQRYHLARGHDGVDQMPGWELPAIPGAGALHSTAKDLAAFIKAQFGLNDSSLYSVMTDTHRPLVDTRIPNHKISLGWNLSMDEDNKAIHWHSAMTAGYSCFIGFKKTDKKGVVLLSNSANSLDDIGLYILDPNNFSLRHYPEIVEITLKQIKNYIGVYNFKNDQSLVITSQGDRLYGQFISQSRHRIHAISDDIFSFDGLNATITFKKERKGKVTSLEFNRDNIVEIAVKAHK